MSEFFSAFDPTSAVAGSIAWHIIWWALVTVVELLAARAASDKADDWQDLFWPKMLGRLDSARKERQAAKRT